MTDGTAALLAAAAWVGALLGAAAPSAAVGWAAAAVVLPAALVWQAVRRPQPPGIVVLLVAVAATASVTGVGAAVRIDAVRTGPLATEVAQVVPSRGGEAPGGAGGGVLATSAVQGLAVSGEVILVSDPRPARRGGWSAIARTSAVGWRGRPPHRSRERVLVRAGPTRSRGSPEDVVDAPPPGGAARLPAMGARVVLTGVATPADGPSADWLRRQGVVVEVRAIRHAVVSSPSALLRGTTAVRARLSTAAWEALPATHASLLTGLVTGDVSGQPDDLAEDVDRAGLAHLVAVSGSNVALVVGGVVVVALAARAGRRAAWWASLVAVWWFVVLVRAEPSVVRAALMASLVLVAAIVGRPRRALPLLCGGVLLALLVDPLLGTRLGFALSVAATLGVLLVTPRLHPHLPLPGPVATVVAATVGAQIAVAPLLLAVGGTAGPSSIPANVVAVPAAAVATAIGAAAAVMGPVAPDVAALLCRLAHPPLAVVVWAAGTFAGPVGRGVDRWTGPLLAGAAVVGLRTAARWLAGRGVGVAADPRSRRLALTALPAGCVVAVAVLGIPAGGGLPADVRMVVLDVGQGDAILVGDPSAGWMLVDGGPDPRALRRALDRHGVDRLAAVVVSHPHADHDGGLAGLLGDMAVGVVVVGPSPPGAPASTVAGEAAAAGVPVRNVVAGATWRLGAVAVRVLSPPPGGIDADANESSLVLRLDVEGGLDALLPGDAEVIAQTRLLRDRQPLDVDVLKVPHHGGATNAEGFLAATTPQVAVISAGEGNPFGHPHPDVLGDLVATEVLRTDLDGDVVVQLAP